MSAPPELTCRALVELVTDYLEGVITDPDRLELIEAHLQLCDPCVIYVEQMRHAIATLGQLPNAQAVEQAEELPDSIREQLLNAFRAEFPS